MAGAIISDDSFRPDYAVRILADPASDDFERLVTQLPNFDSDDMFLYGSLVDHSTSTVFIMASERTDDGLAEVADALRQTISRSETATELRRCSPD